MEGWKDLGSVAREAEPRLASPSAANVVATDREGGGSEAFEDAHPVRWPEDTPLLHIHGQWIWHGEAELIGNVLGLEALAAAITAALRDGKATALAFCRDGEGYGVTVRRTNSTGMNYSLLPYRADFAAEDQREHIERLQFRVAELEALLFGPSEGSQHASDTREATNGEAVGRPNP